MVCITIRFYVSFFLFFFLFFFFTVDLLRRDSEPGGSCPEQWCVMPSRLVIGLRLSRCIPTTLRRRCNLSATEDTIQNLYTIFIPIIIETAIVIYIIHPFIPKIIAVHVTGHATKPRSETARLSQAWNCCSECPQIGCGYRTGSSNHMTMNETMLTTIARSLSIPISHWD